MPLWSPPQSARRGPYPDRSESLQTARPATPAAPESPVRPAAPVPSRRALRRPGFRSRPAAPRARAAQPRPLPTLHEPRAARLRWPLFAIAPVLVSAPCRRAVWRRRESGHRALGAAPAAVRADCACVPVQRAWRFARRAGTRAESPPRAHGRDLAPPGCEPGRDRCATVRAPPRGPAAFLPAPAAPLGPARAVYAPPAGRLQRPGPADRVPLVP